MAVATAGMQHVWVTRLRANLPVSALKDDLRLEASPDQRPFSNLHVASEFSDPRFDPCGGSSGSDDEGCNAASGKGSNGSWLLIVSTALVVAGMLRRRRG